MVRAARVRCGFLRGKRHRQNDLACEFVWRKHRFGRNAQACRAHALKRPTYKLDTQRSRKRQRVETKRDEAQSAAKPRVSSLLIPALARRMKGLTTQQPPSDRTRCISERLHREEASAPGAHHVPDVSMARADDASLATATCGGRIGRWLRTYDAFQPDAAICEAALPCPRSRRVCVARCRAADFRSCLAACLCGIRCTVVRCYVILISCVASVGGFPCASGVARACIVGCIDRAARACGIACASRGACQRGIWRVGGFCGVRRSACIGGFRRIHC